MCNTLTQIYSIVPTMSFFSWSRIQSRILHSICLSYPLSPFIWNSFSTFFFTTLTFFRNTSQLLCSIFLISGSYFRGIPFSEDHVDSHTVSVCSISDDITFNHNQGSIHQDFSHKVIFPFEINNKVVVSLYSSRGCSWRGWEFAVATILWLLSCEPSCHLLQIFRCFLIDFSVLSHY